MSGPEQSFNVGVVGYGLSARVFHIPFILATPSLVLHSIAQRPQRAGSSAGPSSVADHPAVVHRASADALLADAAVDVVVVCTPPDTHLALVRDALRAGKHVLCEKPLVPRADEARELAALASARGRVLAVYQNRRWDGDFALVRNLIGGGGDGPLGRVLEFETHFDRYRPAGAAERVAWKAELGMAGGGGPLYDLGSHLLDQVYVLFGRPKSAWGKFAWQRVAKEAEGGSAEPDAITAVLEYDGGGPLAIVRIGAMSAESRQLRFWVRGARGSYKKFGLDPQEDQLKAGVALDDPAFGTEGPEHAGVLSLVQEDGKTVVDRPYPPQDHPPTYKEFYSGFARALASGNKDDVPVSADQVADVLDIIEAVRESAETGKEVLLS